MGSCGGSLTSASTGDEGGLSVLSSFSGSIHPSDSSAGHVVCVPRSADSPGPANLYMEFDE